MGILANPLVSLRNGMQSHERSSSIRMAASRSDMVIVPFLINFVGLPRRLQIITRRVGDAHETKHPDTLLAFRISPTKAFGRTLYNLFP